MWHVTSNSSYILVPTTDTCQTSCLLRFVNGCDVTLSCCWLSRTNIHCVPKTCDHFLMISWTKTVRLQRFLTHITESVGHLQVFLVSHLTYLVQLLYLGNCQDLNIMNLGLNCWFSQCYNTRILTAKLSPYYFIIIQLMVYKRTITRFIADDKVVYQRVR